MGKGSDSGTASIIGRKAGIFGIAGMPGICAVAGGLEAPAAILSSSVAAITVIARPED